MRLSTKLGVLRASYAPQSLAGRLLLGSALATALALAVVLILMHAVLTRFVTGQIDQRLDNKIVALASQLRVAPGGVISLAGQADGPPFDSRHQQSFWLVQGPRNALMTGWLAPGEVLAPSRDELDEVFRRPGPPPPAPGGLAAHPRTLRKEALGGVAMHERIARYKLEGVAVTILAAAPNSAIIKPVGEAMTTVGFAVLVLGAILAALAFAQVRLGLKPLRTLRQNIAQVADGQRELVPEPQPYEVAPLVGELNHLLERHAANLEKARRNVANLAHGLRTPLATLQLGLERLDGPGKKEMLDTLAQVDHHLRHHLGRARATVLAGPARTHTALAPCLDAIGDALRHVYCERDLTVSIDCPAGLSVACDSNDCNEIFGNLLDNAFKFATAQVRCTVLRQDRRIRVTIADDGPGLAFDEVALVMRPGQRLDETKPGFGFGLSIVRELVELYGGELSLESGGPGLHATVWLPAHVRAAEV